QESHGYGRDLVGDRMVPPVPGIDVRYIEDGTRGTLPAEAHCVAELVAMRHEQRGHAEAGGEDHLAPRLDLAHDDVAETDQLAPRRVVPQVARHARRGVDGSARR